MKPFNYVIIATIIITSVCTLSTLKNPYESNNFITPKELNIVQIATSDWSLPQYNEWSCVNRSNLTFEKLTSQGYNVRICRGYNFTTQMGHSWLMIEVGPNEWKDFECNNFNFEDVGHNYEFTNVYNEKELVKWY